MKYRRRRCGETDCEPCHTKSCGECHGCLRKKVCILKVCPKKNLITTEEGNELTSQLSCQDGNVPTKKESELYSDQRVKYRRQKCGKRKCEPCHRKSCGECLGCTRKKMCVLRVCPNRVLVPYLESETHGQKCTTCFKVFASTSTMSRHKKVCIRHHTNYTYRCTICSVMQPTIVDWQHHKKETSHSTYDFKCNYCDQVFQCANSVNAHCTRKHRQVEHMNDQTTDKLLDESGGSEIARVSESEHVQAPETSENEQQIRAQSQDIDEQVLDKTSDDFHEECVTER